MSCYFIVFVIFPIPIIVWTNSFHLMNQELKRTINFCQVFYTIFYYKTTTQTTDSYLVPIWTHSRERDRGKSKTIIFVLYFNVLIVISSCWYTETAERGPRSLRGQRSLLTWKGTRHENVPEIHIETWQNLVRNAQFIIKETNDSDISSCVTKIKEFLSP